MPRKKQETIPEKVEEAIEKAGKKVKEKVEELSEEAVKSVKKALEEEKKEVVEEKINKLTKKELEEKAKVLAEKIVEKEKKQEVETKIEEKPKKENKQEEEKKQDKEGKTLVPLDDYVKAGCYIGTKVITPDMRKYLYRRRNDGIAIINTNLIDEKLKEAVKFLAGYAPEDFIIVCKREAGWRAVKLFSELIGVKVFTKKYPAGIITNINLPDFFETELVFICDPWLDKNALNDAINVKKKIMGIFDTNNLTKGADIIIPANNKSNKSLGLVFYILAKEYMKARGIDKKLPLVEEFIGEKLEELPMKEKKKKKEEDEKKRDIEKIERIMKENEE